MDKRDGDLTSTNPHSSSYKEDDKQESVSFDTRLISNLMRKRKSKGEREAGGFTD